MHQGGGVMSTPRLSKLPGLALSLAVAGAALLMSLWLPVASPLLTAILAGVLATNTTGIAARLEPGLAVASRRLLRIGIVLLGLKLSLGDILGLGWQTIVLVVAVVGGGLLVAEYAGRSLAIPPTRRLLIGCGFSICGAAAVAAVEGTLEDAEDEDVVTALALVVLFGTLMIPLVPVVVAGVGWTPRAGGLWAGASVHEVAQVVAAAGLIGPAALKVGVVVKLARVLLLAPIIAGLGLMARRRAAASTRTSTGPSALPPIVPLFVAGFLAAAAVRSTGIVPGPALDAFGYAQTILLAAAMFALGCGVKARTLLAVGGRPVALAAIVTTAVAGIAAGGVVWIG